MVIGSVHFNSIEKPRFPLSTSLVGPRANVDVSEKRKSLTLPGNRFPDGPVRRLVATPKSCPVCFNNTRQKFKHEIVACVMLLTSVMWYRAVWSVDADVSAVPTACVT
jgi:hypothetical protein